MRPIGMPEGPIMASMPLEFMHPTKGGMGWFPIEYQELKLFLGIHILMGLKRNPSVQSY